MLRCSTKCDEYINSDTEVPKNMIQQRMFIRGFPSTTISADIEGLFNRVGIVKDVYIPGPTPTGLFRDFAIVIMMFSSKDDISKCVKTLNNVLWKGNKVQVEVAAKPYYRDKLEIERMEEAQKQQENEEEPPTLANGKKSMEEEVSEYLNTLPVFDPCNEDSKYLNIKNPFIRDSKPLSVRTTPATDDLNSVAKAKLQKTRKLRFGWKILFDENCEPMKSTQNEANSIKENHNDVPKGNELQELKFKPAIGKRVGFGTLLADAEKYPENYEEVRDSSYITHAPNESDEEDEADIKTKLHNIYDDDREEMIRKEKDRTKNLLADLLSRSERSSNVADDIIKDHEHTEDKSIDEAINGEKKEEATMETKDSFVNLSKLGDIFHKDGGIWWGDDGTLKETVMKGDIDQVDNARFREAEKLGIDIRPVTAEEKSSKSFKLNFFPDEEERNESSEPSNAEPSFSFSFGFKPDKNEDMSANPSISNAPATNPGTKRRRESIEEYNSRIEREEYKSKSLIPVSLQDVISTCKLFAREETEEAFTERWKLQREKLVTDYKRKKRDSKRRTKYHGKTVAVDPGKEISGENNTKIWSPRFRKKFRGNGKNKRRQKK